METIKIKISGEFIRLDTLLKLSGIVTTGGQAKLLIQDGRVMVNGKPCIQRGKKIKCKETVQTKNVTVEVI